MEQEISCIKALRTLYDGSWRKRAWIFQEILLSKKLLLSIQGSEFIKFSDIGVMANLLFQRHPKETWLRIFSDWCRRLFYLRHFYTESTFHHLSDANVLQMATELQASVPADKIYALCSILNLKDVPYNPSHSPDDALKVVIGELVRKGRLSWLYAVPAPLNVGGFHLDATNFTPFVLTRLSDRLVRNWNKMHFSDNSVGFPARCIGQIVRTKPLAEVLREANNWAKKAPAEFRPELEYLFFVPKMIRRIALDIMNPLLVEPLFGQICRALGINTESLETRPTRVWRMIFLLFTKDVTSELPKEIHTTSDEEDRVAALLALSTAKSLQERLKTVQHDFHAIW